MRLSRLEMIGFKSFVNRTLLQFTPDITAIVGPNGCGKSNIVDALRWVMGEQSARHLRGHLMEDVIFNGNETHPATGMAEVSLVLDNEDGRGPGEYGNFSEIVVSRRLFRSGESEYSINKVPCRLKDIIELFLGTGVGNKAYSIMEQGRISEMINSKPEEFRNLIEEAAGISKYMSRKLGAERKLERTRQNLLRLSDIVKEIERQIHSVELQAKRAERYRSIREELKGKELAWGGMQRRELAEEISRYDKELEAVEDRSVQSLVFLRSQEAETEEAKRTLLEEEGEVGALQESAYQCKVQISSDEQKVQFLKRDHRELLEAENKATIEVHDLEAKLEKFSQEIESFKKAGVEFVQLSLFEGTYLREKEEELDRVKSEISSAQRTLEQEREKLVEIMNLAAQVRNDQLISERRREEIEKKLAEVTTEQAEVSQSSKAWGQKRQEMLEILGRTEDRAKDVNAELDEAQEKVQECTGLKEGYEREFNGLKEQWQEIRSKLASLEALQKNYEGYQEGVRAIMFRRQSKEAFDGIHGVVADIIDVPEPYEKALTAVLGERLQYIIVQSHEDGLEAIEYLKRESAGRGTFIPHRVSHKEERSATVAEPEVVSPLLGLVSVKEGYGAVAEYLLGDVVVVRDLKSGLGLWGRNGFVNTLVTPDGEVIDPSGVITGGSLDNLQGNLLTQRRRMKELVIELSDLEARLKERGKELKGVKARLEATEERRVTLIDEGHRLDLDRVQSEHEFHQVEQELKRLEESDQRLWQEKEELSAGLQSFVEQIIDCRTKCAALAQERGDEEKRVEEMEGTLSRLMEESKLIESHVTGSRVRTASLSEKKENAQLNMENRINLKEDLSLQIRSVAAQLTEMGLKRERINKEASRTEGNLEEGRRTLEGLEQRLERERGAYRDLSRRLTEMEEAIKEVRFSVESSQEEKNRLQLLLSEKKLNLQHLTNGIREKYGVDLSEVHRETDPGQEASEHLPEDIEELRGRLERMGEVNLTAIGEFEDLKSRHQFLSQQKEDLEKSTADLQQTIAKLNRFCRIRFKESFDDINQRFQEIFTRLFRGGKARLVLTDENDYLQTGVDIIVQPPGKKLQSITLLSGGEKALTAISLLFGIFLTKPSPFCILDEVDAPLDDANVERFIEMLEEMSQSSQFVLVTHNKRTMQSAGVLYGITMADPGVSKVVSVKMN